MLPYCDTAYVTYIDNSYSADTFIPNLDKLTDEWYIADESDECTYFDIEYYLELIREKNKLVLQIWTGLCGLRIFDPVIKIINYKILKIPFNMAKLKAN